MDLRGLATIPTGALFVTTLFFGGLASTTACGTAPFVFDTPRAPKIVVPEPDAE